MANHAKKLLLGTVAMGAIYTGGIGSCHYALSHYYYAKEKYDQSVSHARKAGSHFPPYKQHAFNCVLNTMLTKGLYDYTSCKDYYEFYIRDPPHIPLEVMHLQDRQLMLRLQFPYSFLHYNSAEGAFFTIHKSGYGMKRYSLRYEKLKRQVLNYKPSENIKYPKIIRRFVHMFNLNMYSGVTFMELYIDKEKPFDARITEIDKNVSLFATYINTVLKENDYLFHLEYGLLGASIFRDLKEFMNDEQEKAKKLEKSLHQLGEAVQTIEKKKLTPLAKKYPDLKKGIEYIQETIEKYK